MGYTATGAIADLFDVGPVDRAADRITRRTGEHLHERVTHHTPVATPPRGFDVKSGTLPRMETWLSARGGRTPGTLKRSWKIGRVEAIFERRRQPRDASGAFVGRERRSIDVYTTDPIAPHVEWDTQPHIIVPKNPSGWLRFWDRHGAIVFARIVHHPGTRGQHMMATALAETAAAWRGIAVEEVALWARTYFRGGPPSLPTTDGDLELRPVG